MHPIIVTKHATNFSQLYYEKIMTDRFHQLGVSTAKNFMANSKHNIIRIVHSLKKDKVSLEKALDNLMNECTALLKK